MSSLPDFFSVSLTFCPFCFILPCFSSLFWTSSPVLRSFRLLTLRLALQQTRCAIRGYVNCFQPRVLLVAKQIEGRSVHRVYDAARTPLQCLLLSGVLPTSKQEELRAVAKALDPIRLFHQVEQLQQAVFHCEVNGSAPPQRTPATSLVKFELEDGTTEPLPAEGMVVLATWIIWSRIDELSCRNR